MLRKMMSLISAQHALMLAYHHSSRLLTSRDEAATRTRSGVERLISAARPTV